MLRTSHQTQTGISREISWIHQDCAQKARHKWFKKDMKEKNRKGRIMMTVTQEIIWNPSDFCCWRKKGYLQCEWLLPHYSPVLEKAECAAEGCGVCCTAMGVPMDGSLSTPRQELWGLESLWNSRPLVTQTCNIPSPPVSKCGPISAAGGAVLCAGSSSPWWKLSSPSWCFFSCKPHIFLLLCAEI